MKRDTQIDQDTMDEIRRELAEKATGKLKGRDREWAHYRNFEIFAQELLGGVSVNLPPERLFQKDFDSVLAHYEIFAGTDEYLSVTDLLTTP